MRNQWVHYEVFEVGMGGATHKKADKHDYLDNIIPDLVNGNVFKRNARKLTGINGITILDTINGMYVSQIGGYNGNVGMYGYLVNPDESLDRFC